MYVYVCHFRVRSRTRYACANKFPSSRDFAGLTVLPRGFEYEGEVYTSLSAVAKVVTGTHWNGYHFFGLRRKGGDR